MDRSVSCRFDAQLHGTADIVVSVAVAADASLASESIDDFVASADVLA